MLRTIVGLVLVSGSLIGCDRPTGDQPRGSAVEVSPTPEQTDTQVRLGDPQPQRPAPGIAFSALREGGRRARFELMFIRRDGAGLEQLSRYRDARHPLWSPDGRHIAYIHGTQDREDLWIMDADGSDDRLLVDGPVVTPGGFAWPN